MFVDVLRKLNAVFSTHSLFIGSLVIAFLFTLNACIKIPQTNRDSTTDSLDFQMNTTHVNSRAISDNLAFEQSLHPILLANCRNCHGSNSVTTAQFAHIDTTIAINEIAQSNLIDKILPEQSGLVLKLKNQLHNCWTTCEQDAFTIANAIVQWQELSVSPGETFYNKLCSTCHGIDGKGTTRASAFVLPLVENQLLTKIEATMPPALPSLCNVDCAIEVAQYMLNTFNTPTTIHNTITALATLPTGSQQLSDLCTELISINRADIISDVFCNPTAPVITNLGDLQELLGLAFTTPNPIQTFPIPYPNPEFVLSGHSTSLVAKSTSAINPRVIIFTHSLNAQKLSDMVIMGFNRGEQFVEIMTIDRNNSQLFFYLFVFEKACNKSNSCTNADLLTREVEINWTDYTVYSQTNLKNTVFDCLQCHQPDGPGTPSIIRMQELNFPWTHFFSMDTEGGNALYSDYLAAHTEGDTYANIPPAHIIASRPESLEAVIVSIAGPPGAPAPTPSGVPAPSPSPGAAPPFPWNGFVEQPNQFNSFLIEDEVKISNPQQPIINDPPGISPTWSSIYEASVRGEFIQVPYHDVKVTDPIKLATMSQAYNDYLNGLITAADFPDIRDVFLESKLAEIGFKVKPGLDGSGIIIHACTQCHNSKLDQTISRARFNVDLTMMSDTQGGVLMGIERDNEIAIAINRLRLANSDIHLMPPVLFKTLDPAEIELAVQYLCSQITSAIASCVK